MSKTAASGIVALIFMVVGFQAATFINKFYRISRDSKADETVAEVQSADTLAEAKAAERQNVASNEKRIPQKEWKDGRTELGGYPAPSAKMKVKRKYESFRFDPNTVTVEDLTRLGLTEKQAASIDNYRKKGGRFRKKSDFAKMYVVSDTLFERLEPFIDIPKIEINGADTTRLKELPGIGSYYAKKIIQYRDLLGGFYSIEQLLEIEGISNEKFDSFKEFAFADSTKVERLDIWKLDEDSLALHPYVGINAAKGIVRFRTYSDSTLWQIDELIANGILTKNKGDKLKKYQ